jgi:hypothetical protein
MQCRAIAAAASLFSLHLLQLCIDRRAMLEVPSPRLFTAAAQEGLVV